MVDCKHETIFRERIGYDAKWRCQWCYEVIEIDGQDYSEALPQVIYRVKKSKK